MGVLEALTIVFVVLKLLDVIDWSWWWVVSPLYVYGVALVGLFILGVVTAVTGGYEARKRKRSRRK